MAGLVVPLLVVSCALTEPPPPPPPPAPMALEALVAAGADPKHIPSRSPVAAATPSVPPTSIVDAGANPTLTPVRSPTASATPVVPPTPTVITTATPTPTPTVPALSINMTLQTPAIAQGGVQIVLLTSNTALTSVSGTVGERPLLFWKEEERWYALVGFLSDAALGARQVTVTAEDAAGGLATATADFQVVAGDFVVEEIWLPPGQEGLLAPEVLNTEWTALLSLTSTVTPQRRWTGAFVPPVAGGLSSSYGTRRSYNGGPPESPHQGTDFAVDVGTQVVAANAGIVVFAGVWQVRGNAIVIDHGIGVYSGAYHLSELLVEEGQEVAKGEIIGRVGASGMATGPHLHWDMVVQGTHTSPVGWMEFALPLPAATAGGIAN